MKTAVSIPAELYSAAESTRARLKMSRSELYARALEAFLRGHEAAAMTETINRVLSGAPQRVDPALARMQAASLGSDEGDFADWVDASSSPKRKKTRHG